MSVDDSPFNYGQEAIATDQPHAPERPESGQLAQGYPEGQAVPASELNWFWLMLSIAHRSAAPFSDLRELVDFLAPGQSGVLLEEADGSVAPGAAVVAADISASGTIAVDGRRVYTFSGALEDRVEARPRDPSAAVEQVYGVPGGSTGGPTATNGRFVVSVYRTEDPLMQVRCWDADGTLRWTYTVPGNPNVFDVAIDAERVYICHQPDSDGDHVTALDLDVGTASAAWKFDHGELVYSIAAGAGRVFIAGVSSTNVVQRALDAEDGSELWTTTTGTDEFTSHPYGQCLATDGERLWQAHPLAATDTITCRSVVDGELVRGVGWVDPVNDTLPTRCLAVDQDYLFVGSNSGGATQTGATYALDKRDMCTIWGSEHGAHLGPISAASDGAAVFAMSANGTVRRYLRGNRPTRFVRVDGQGQHLPYKRLAIPEGR